MQVILRRKYWVILVIIGVIFIFIISLRLRKPVIYGKIAIVIDDFGYNLDNLKILSQIKQPLTISVLPNLAYSKEIAKIARDLRKEVILHLPLEPHQRENIRLEKNTILTTMEDEEIKEILNSAILSTPFIKGVSNHMGSKATEDERVMKIIFEELKRKNLFFLDSRVSPFSICEALSKKLNLRFIKRDLFLDTYKDPHFIRKQILLLMAEAKRKGEAVGIAHEHPLTLKILRDFLPKIEKKGFKFVFLSELVR